MDLLVEVIFMKCKKYFKRRRVSGLEDFPGFQIFTKKELFEKKSINMSG